MTETEWLACTDPEWMPDFLKGRASGRKLRLFACACLRRMVHLGWPDAEPSKALEVSEAFADGRAGAGQLAEVRSNLWAMGGISPKWAVNCAGHAVLDDDAHEAATGAVHMGRQFYYLRAAARRKGRNWFVYDVNPETPEGIAAREVGSKEQAEILRDVTGNPFRPVTLDPPWLTPAVVSLARTIYDERAFGRVPELANALVKAGCTNRDILEHCRSGGPHVRGCWVVDLILGKS